MQRCQFNPFDLAEHCWFSPFFVGYSNIHFLSIVLFVIRCVQLSKFLFLQLFWSPFLGMIVFCKVINAFTHAASYQNTIPAEHSKCMSQSCNAASFFILSYLQGNPERKAGSRNGIRNQTTFNRKAEITQR